MSYIDVICSTIWHVLNILKLENIWDNQNDKPYINLKPKLEYKFAAEWYNKINNETSRKLKTYSSFKNEFIIEDYITLQPLKQRRQLTKLRISAHSLMIETGRYKKIAPASRLCPLCNLNEIENEEHFLLRCPLYSNLRKSLFDKLHDLPTENNQLLLSIINLKDQDTLSSKLICQYIDDAFSLRRITMNQNLPDMVIAKR